MVKDKDKKLPPLPFFRVDELLGVEEEAPEPTVINQPKREQVEEPKKAERRVPETHFSALHAQVGPHGNLWELTELNLVGSSEVDFSFLALCEQLERLVLRGTAIESLDVLRGLTQLRYLDVSQTAIRSLDALSELELLEELDASETEISELSALGGLHALRVLTLRKTKVTEIDAVVGLPLLEKLDLKGCAIGDLNSLRKLGGSVRISLSRGTVDRFRREQALARKDRKEKEES